MLPPSPAADSSMHACGGAGRWKVLLLMTGRYNLGLRRRWQSSHHKFHLLLVSCRHAPPLSTLTSHVTGQLTINCCLQASAELQMISLVYASAYVDNIDLYSFSPQPKLDWMIISPLESNHCSCVQPISPPLHCTATATNCATDCSMFLQLSHAAIKRRLSS